MKFTTPCPFVRSVVIYWPEAMVASLPRYLTISNPLLVRPETLTHPQGARYKAYRFVKFLRCTILLKRMSIYMHIAYHSRTQEAAPALSHYPATPGSIHAVYHDATVPF